MRIRGAGDLGHFGVLLFFVHTALVLMMSMERLGMAGWNLYKAFVIRRLFRIYPLSILSVCFVVCFRVPSIPWSGSYEWVGWPVFVSNALLTQNLTQSSSVICVLWSLPFEIQMYAILPLLFMLILRFPSPRATVGVWSVAVGVAAAEYIARPAGFNADFLLARYFPCFVAGVFAWRLMSNVRARRLPGWAWMTFLLFLVVAYRLVSFLRAWGPSAWGTDLLNDWLFCAAVGLAVPHFLEIRNRCLKSISSQIARYSYGIYVSHIPILWLCFVRFQIASGILSAALAVLLTALTSVLLYHSLEDPAIRVGKRFAGGPPLHPTRASRPECTEPAVATPRA
jgi:peptidoglycan/LPS O-acetylase OafA/YrhL